MRKIIIIGASGHSKVIVDIIEKRNEYKIIGFIDSYKIAGEQIMGYSVLGNENIIRDLMENHNVIGGIIGIGDNWLRSKIRDKIKSLSPNFKFLSAIHPNSVLPNNYKIKQGVVIMAGTIVNSASKIEDFCILNTKSSLGHDSLMQKFSSLAPNATIGGNVKIGEFSAVSISATIIHNTKIGKHTIIGAGSLVLKNIGNNLIAYGVPAKKIRERQNGDSYLTN